MDLKRISGMTRLLHSVRSVAFSEFINDQSLNHVALRAIEMDADCILLAKAIDGVYDSDPKINPDAKKYDTITIQEVIDKQLAVVDLTASIMCMENHVPMAVFSLNEKDGIVNAMRGKINGTVVTA